jgi:Zn-dependent M28 family amino/carboxypeptidase
MNIRFSLLLLSFVISAVFIVHSCNTKPLTEPPVELNENEIVPHIKELADDKYMGRMPFGPGDPLAVAYLVDQCKSIGLLPGNGDSYTQSVPMIEVTSTITEDMKIKTPSGDASYTAGTDYVINCPKAIDKVAVQDAEMVFCGYGINAPEIGWNDYEGIDMKGKIAVVLVNDPGFGGEDSSFFKGNTMTYYGRWTYKYEEADRQGAKGLLIIHETSSAGYPWFVVESSWSGPQLGLEKESVANGADIKGWIHLNMAKDLFEKANLNLSDLIKAARKPGFKPVPMNTKLSTALANTYKRDQSDNVIAILPGTTKKEEYILYSAHWDHIGVGKAIDGDSIYNGALDNASGTAIMLAIAKGFTEQKAKPERSIIFTWVTAEEQGLLGSEYYALKPTFPLDQTVCNINIDGCNPNGAMRDFQIVGIGHSEMDRIAAEELASQDRYVLPDQEPEKGYFFRSDHFNFAKAGVPALFGEGGYDHIEKGIAYGRAKKAEYTAKNYHAPSDEYDPATWDMSGVVQDAQLYYNIGWRLANSDEWPKWNPNSEFRRPNTLKD